jgi:hypothetical protein
MSYIFGDFMGPETTSVEYKLFTFFPKGLNLDSNTSYAEDLVYNGKWIFNNSVIENLVFYLDYYLPKYTSAYLNHNSEVNNGELVIGISDDGVVYGIPYKGNLNSQDSKKFLNSKIEDIINKNIKLDNESINIYNYLEWEILEVQSDNIDNNNKSLIKKVNEYENQIKVFNLEMNKFKSKKKVWYDLIMRYNDKLHNMLNDKDKRKEVINYIFKNDVRIKNKFVSSNKLILKLKSNFKFSSINNDEILKHKNDNDSIWYWVTKWKDYMIDFIKEIKPTPPSNISSNLYPLSILTSVVDMIPRWVVKEKINLYILKFKFKKPKEDINIKYLSESLYKSCYRCNIDDNPCVHPF